MLIRSSKKSRVLLACAVVFTVLAQGFANVAAAQVERRSAILRDALVRPIPSDGLRISVVLREPAPTTSRPLRRGGIMAKQDGVFERLPAGRFKVGRRYQNLSGFSVWADTETIAALNDDPDVVSIDLDRRVFPATAQGAAIVGATTVKALGVTGAGVGVAVIDTGIDTDHPQVSGSLVAEACFCDNAGGPFGCCPNGFDTQTGAGAAEDHDGHGTNVSGVIVSNSVTNEGVAPDASIVAIKVFGSTGGGGFSDVASALDWVITNHLTYGIKVVNLSLSDGGEYNDALASPCTGTNTANAIALLKNTHGISVFVASGNDGFDAGISFPACVPQAFSVGGVYDQGFGSVNWGICTDTSVTADTFVCHTSSGSLLDLVAPDFRTLVPTLGGGVVNAGGTSIASPYAAAAAALLLDADAALSPDEVLTWLGTGAPSVTNPDNALSFPRARVDVAVPLLLAVCGNSVLEVGEACDDGNTVDGDCCDSVCEFETVGSGCDDGDLCSTVDSCDGAGTCVGSSPLVCDDSEICTDDSCIPASGCAFVPNTDPCDDANACTDGDVCAGGSCTAGGALDCDDLDACTADSCDEVSGCFHEPILGCGDVPPVPSSTGPGLVTLSIALLTLGLWRRQDPAKKPIGPSSA